MRKKKKTFHEQILSLCVDKISYIVKYFVMENLPKEEY